MCVGGDGAKGCGRGGVRVGDCRWVVGLGYRRCRVTGYDSNTQTLSRILSLGDRQRCPAVDGYVPLLYSLRTPEVEAFLDPRCPQRDRFQIRSTPSSGNAFEK